MSKKFHKGSAHIAIAVGLVVIISGLLGYVLWHNITSKNNSQSATKVSKSINNKSAPTTDSKEIAITSPQTVAKNGSVSGSLVYPSERIPDDLQVVATDQDTGKYYTTETRLQGSQYQYGFGYEIELPPGRYEIYGVLKSKPKDWAYYDKFITCGMKADCTDTTPIDVTVSAGRDTPGITVGDWWHPFTPAI